MPSTYTTNLGIELPADGELDGVWGDVVNENMDILDRAINGSIALSLSGTTSTLTTSDGALSDGQYKLLVLGGSPSGTHTITIAPSDAQKIYFVRNTTAQSVVFTQGSGGNVTVATGDSAIIYSDGAGAGAAVVNITNDFAMSSVKITGGTIDGTVIGGTSAAAVTGTTITGTSFVSSGDMTFGDSDKAIFGAGSDLQIYHDGSNSYIDDVGTGSLYIRGTHMYLQRADGTENYIGMLQDGAVNLYHNGLAKLATTATGVAVTGDVGATTGTFSGDVTIADKIVHSGDTNTAIRFPAADTVTVETSGAERVRVDSSGNVGIGTAAPAYQLDVSSTATTLARFQHSDGNVAEIEIVGTLGATTIAERAGATAFDRDGTERMRITSAGNVGIGTTAPAELIHIAGGASAAYLKATNSAGTQGIEVGVSATGDGVVNVQDAKALRLFTTDTERMRIDSSGNVGIGTASPSAKLDVRTGTTGNIAAFYGTSTYHLAIEEVGGVMFLDANNGSATIGFKTNDTERMRLDSSGNLGLGVTPSAWATLVPAIQLGGGGSFIAAQGSGTVNSDSIYIGTNAHFNGTNWLYKETNHASYSLQANGQHRFFTAPSGTAGNAITFTQAMTLDASGHLYPDTTAQTLGTSAKRWGTVFATSLSDGADQLVGSSGTTARLGYGSGWTTLAFATGGTERARIDASGNLLVGTTGTPSGAANGVMLSASGQGIFSKSAAASLLLYRPDSNGNIAEFYKGSTNVGSISVTGTATAYNTSSDYRLKEDVQPMVGASDRVLSLNPVNFAWKADGSRTDGFIAHEVQAVAPQAVMGVKDGEEMQAIDHSKLVPLLTAALQEALTEIALLKARLDAANI